MAALVQRLPIFVARPAIAMWPHERDHVAMKRAKASSVGIRALKNETSAIIRRVRRGEALTVTDRDEAVALLSPIPSHVDETAVRKLVAEGRLAWSGGKPIGSARRVVLRGPTVSAAVIEDRR